MEQRVNVAPPAIGADLAGKNNDFLLGPLLVPRQSGQCEALKAGRFGLSLVPGEIWTLCLYAGTFRRYGKRAVRKNKV